MTGFPRLGEAEPEKARLADICIAIVGLGLMGGSLALALHGENTSPGKCARLIGIDTDRETIAKASERGIADIYSTEPAELLPQANLVILATPVRAILDLLGKLPSMHPGPVVVLDLGSTKSKITAVMERLPAHFHPVGGHPMCGKEHSGLDLADAHLYAGAPFALVALPQTPPHAAVLIEELVQAIGAQPFWVEAETHDRWVASTSHLPYLLANSLAAVTPLEAAPLAGPGYRSTSRLAVSQVDMMIDILATNRLSVLDALQRYQAHLTLIESCLEKEDEKALREILSMAARRQEAILDNEQRLRKSS